MISNAVQITHNSRFRNFVNFHDSHELFSIVGIFIFLFVLYALTSPRTIALEDDGIFVLASYFLGVAHPPGYPLHTLIGKLFTFLPVGSVAYRVHLVSAFFGALSGVMLYLVIRRLINSRSASIIGAICFGLSPVFWSQSIIAEVYTLNAFLFLVVVFFILRAYPLLPGYKPPSSRTVFYSLLLAALFYGLSLANHWPLIGLSTPGLLVMLWPLRSAVLKKLPILVAASLVGLTPYVWLVIRSHMNPVISFYGPITNWHDFWFMASRHGYASVDTSATATLLDKLEYLQFMIVEVGRQFRFVGVVLVVVGFVVQWRKLPKPLSIGLSAIAFCNSILLILLLKFDFEFLQRYVFRVYPVLTYGVMSIWLALGAEDTINTLRRRLRFQYAWAGIALVTIIPVFYYSFGELDRHEYNWSKRYAENLLSSLPKNSVLFVKGDVEVGTLAYFHYIEHLRPDITLLNTSGLVLDTRLFFPLRVNSDEANAYILKYLETSNKSVSFTRSLPPGKHGVDHWLYVTLDTRHSEPKGVISPPQEKFFLSGVFMDHEKDPWTIFFQNLLKERFAAVYAVSKTSRSTESDEQDKKLTELFMSDFYTSLGFVEGVFANHHNYDLATVQRYLSYAQKLYPNIAQKSDNAKYFELLGYYFFEVKDEAKAVASLEHSVEIWPSRDNHSVDYLMKYFKKTRQGKKYEQLARRFKGAMDQKN